MSQGGRDGQGVTRAFDADECDQNSEGAPRAPGVHVLAQAAFQEQEEDGLSQVPDQQECKSSTLTKKLKVNFDKTIYGEKFFKTTNYKVKYAERITKSTKSRRKL